MISQEKCYGSLEHGSADIPRRSDSTVVAVQNATITRSPASKQAVCVVYLVLR